MGVLRFTSSGSNRLKWTTLAQALKDVSDGAWTMAIGVKRATDDASFHGLGYLLSGTGDGTVEAGVSLNSSDQLVGDGITSASTVTITGTTEHYFVVVSKAAGTGAYTYSRYVKSTGVWTHQAPTSVGDQIDATMLEIGAWQNGDFFNGWIPVCAWWEGAMSQAHKEALVTNWQTSDLWASAHGQPEFLVELNVAAASVVDLAGNASGTSHTGTSLDGAETFDSWNFDGTGAGAGVTGTIALTLPALTQDAAGTLTVAGDVAGALPALTQDASGALTVAGDAASTLPALTQDATGVLTVTGAAAQTLPALTQDATGTVEVEGVSGTVAQTLPALTQDAAGTVTQPVEGSVAQTLPALTQDAQGTVEVEQVPVPPPTGGGRWDYGDESAIEGLPKVRAKIESTLPALESSATGLVRPRARPVRVVRRDPTRTGHVESTLPALESRLVGEVAVRASGSGALPALEQGATVRVRVAAERLEAAEVEIARLREENEALQVFLLSDE